MTTQIAVDWRQLYPPRTPMNVIVRDLESRGFRPSNNVKTRHIARRVRTQSPPTAA